jgi:hypothetical protein
MLLFEGGPAIELETDCPAVKGDLAEFVLF